MCALLLARHQASHALARAGGGGEAGEVGLGVEAQAHRGGPDGPAGLQPGV